VSGDEATQAADRNERIIEPSYVCMDGCMYVHDDGRWEGHQQIDIHAVLMGKLRRQPQKTGPRRCGDAGTQARRDDDTKAPRHQGWARFTSPHTHLTSLWRVLGLITETTQRRYTLG
jgi:hypothetical protein